MLRSFPRRTRARTLVALLSASLLLGVAAVPLAAADDLKDKKHKVQRKISGAQNDLDESTARAQQAAAALRSAQVQLDSAQAHLARTRGQLAAAEVLDKQMQAKLDAAVARLAQAREDLAAGRAKIVDEQKELGQIVVSNYQTGDPSLMGLSMVLTSQDPTQLTGQLNSVQNVIDKESVVLDRLEASRALLTVQEQEVEAAKVEVAKERKAAAENLRTKQSLEQQAEDAEAQVSNLVSLRADAQKEADNARKADLAQLQGLQKERNRIEAILRKRAEEARRRAIAAARRAGQSGPILSDNGPIHSNGFLDYPVAGSGHLAVRLADPPDLRLPVAARRRRLRRRLRHPDPRRRLGGRGREVLPDRLGQPGDHRPRLPPRRRARHHHQPHVRAGDRERRPARGARPGRRVRRDHRLVDRLSPALHGAAERQPGEPVQLVLTPPRARGHPRNPVARA